MRVFAGGLLALIAVMGASASDGPAAACSDVAGDPVRVVRVEAEAVLLLADAREVMVAGIAALPGENLTPRIAALIDGGKVMLSQPIGRPDRWNRHLVHVRLNDGRSLAEALITQGHAIRAPGLEPEACRRRLDGFEPSAFPRVRITEEALGAAVRLSGRVTAQRRGSGRIYLDLASREAGAITISLRDRSIEDWTGKRLRLRGWLDWSNGLVVMVAAPFDVEVEAVER